MAKQAVATQGSQAAIERVALTPISEIVDHIRNLKTTIAEHAYALFEARGRRAGSECEDWLRAESELFHAAHVHIHEVDGAYSVSLEVPGFHVNELQVSVEPRTVTVIGRRQKEAVDSKDTAYCEQCSNTIYRAIAMPDEVDVADATAALHNGMLTLRLPKAEKARQIPVEEKSE